MPDEDSSAVSAAAGGKSELRTYDSRHWPGLYRRRGRDALFHSVAGGGTAGRAGAGRSRGGRGAVPLGRQLLRKRGRELYSAAQRRGNHRMRRETVRTLYCGYLHPHRLRRRRGHRPEADAPGPDGGAGLRRGGGQADAIQAGSAVAGNSSAGRSCHAVSYVPKQRDLAG